MATAINGNAGLAACSCARCVNPLLTAEDRAALLGPAPADTPESQARREVRLALLRRDRVERPAIFVGAGTCGLGAGAGKDRKSTRLSSSHSSISYAVFCLKKKKKKKKK